MLNQLPQRSPADFLLDLYDAGQVHLSTGDVNIWAVGPALVVLALLWLAHVSSGRSW